MNSSPPPEFEVIGELSDESIEALAALLLAIVDHGQQQPAEEEVKPIA